MPAQTGICLINRILRTRITLFTGLLVTSVQK